MEIYCWESLATDEVLEEIRIGVNRILLEKIWKRSEERLTLVGGRPIVESREHLEQPDRRPKKLIAGEAREMRQEFVRWGNPVDTCGRSCGSLSIDRTWKYCGSSVIGEVWKDVAQGWTSAKSREGHSWYELRLGGILYPTIIIVTTSVIG